MMRHCFYNIFVIYILEDETNFVSINYLISPWSLLVNEWSVNSITWEVCQLRFWSLCILLLTPILSNKKKLNCWSRFSCYPFQKSITLITRVVHWSNTFRLSNNAFEVKDKILLMVNVLSTLLNKKALVVSILRKNVKESW